MRIQYLRSQSSRVQSTVMPSCPLLLQPLNSGLGASQLFESANLTDFATLNICEDHIMAERYTELKKNTYSSSYFSLATYSSSSALSLCHHPIAGSIAISDVLRPSCSRSSSLAFREGVADGACRNSPAPTLSANRFNTLAIHS